MTPSKEEILAASSGWVAVVLNVVPGLGTGYLYQRRWRAYWLTSALATSWFVAGALLGTLLGVGTSLIWVRANFRVLIGYMLDYHFPLRVAAWYVVLASVVAVLSGHLAARRALRAPILEGLRYE